MNKVQWQYPALAFYPILGIAGVGLGVVVPGVLLFDAGSWRKFVRSC
jgi:hypothetical protein